jgi:hypothetical protein
MVSAAQDDGEVRGIKRSSTRLTKTFAGDKPTVYL